MRIDRLPSRLVTALLALLLVGTAQAQTTYRWIGKDGRVHYSDQPPPPTDIKDLELKKLKGPNVVDTGGAFAYETERAAKNAPLTLYTADTCKDSCQQARELLRRRGAPYTEKEIKTQADATEFRKATGSQDIYVPVLMAGSKAAKGFEEDAWNRLLDNAGYPAQGDAGKKPAVKEEAKKP